MQLDLLLTSLKRNAPDVFQPTVIVNAKKDEFQDGYGICAEEHPDVGFMLEDGLTYQVRSLLRDAGQIAFFTDDDVLYRTPWIPSLAEDGQLICFSLRLGRNTNYCYPYARSQQVPVGSIWNWAGADGDFGYPMSLDGHIFRADDLLPLIRNFSTPNWLEKMLMEGASKIARPWMQCDVESSLVGIPINRVQDEMPNRNGETHPYSIQELNHRYLRGERINLNALDFSDIRGAHQELELVFS